jgi:hypothetical protein
MREPDIYAVWKPKSYGDAPPLWDDAMVVHFLSKRTAQWKLEAFRPVTWKSGYEYRVPAIAMEQSE